jgi:hypothetical protein
VGRRPGRKRDSKRDRFTGGRITPPIHRVVTDGRTAYMTDLVITVEDKKTTATARRLSVLEAIGISGGSLEAGKELERLWHLCRKYATDAPSINAKVSSPHRGGHSHEGELSEGVIGFGVKVHDKYQAGIKAMKWDRYALKEPNEQYGRAVIEAVVAACVENKPLTESGKALCKQGLVVLAKEWNY